MRRVPLHQFFCVHGGISPALQTIDDLKAINRFEEPDESGLLCDLLWSDPHEDYDAVGGSCRFLPNETRGTSFVFTHKAVCEFLDKNNLLSVIRAHEAQDQGYRMYKQNPKTNFPSVITIFSAPNYLDVYNNKVRRGDRRAQPCLGRAQCAKRSLACPQDW